MFIAALCAIVGAPALADMGEMTTILLKTTSWPPQTGNGGEFQGKITGAPITIGSHTIPTGFIFETFCIEEYENVSGGDASYVAVVNSSAVKGGNNVAMGSEAGKNPLYSGSGEAVDAAGQSLCGDPLDPKTAYLYTQFARGELSGYRFGGTLAEHEADAAALQNAIWYIEQEVTSLAAGKATTWVNEATNANWQDIGLVRVLNLYGYGGPGINPTTGALQYTAQDLLIYVPVPVAVLLGLLGLGAAGVKLRKHA
jgi:hypothetical protein